MARPSWDEYFLKMAALAAERSTCIKRQVGAVIVKDKMVISTGYNDTPRGIPNCGDGGCERCQISKQEGSGAAHAGDCICIHAEQNAIIQDAYQGGAALAGSTLYITLEPCISCSKVIINAGIKRVVFANYYEHSTSEMRFTITELFKRAGVLLERKGGIPDEVR
jgi:dCMP deaminase